MATERITENIALDRLGLNLNMSNVFAQGETNNSDIKKILRRAGGKLEVESLNYIEITLLHLLHKR